MGKYNLIVFYVPIYVDPELNKAYLNLNFEFEFDNVLYKKQILIEKTVS